MKHRYLVAFLLSLVFHSTITFAASEGLDAYNAGMNAYKRQEYQNAVYAFEHAVNLDEKLYNAWCMLGLSYILNDEPQKGEKTYLKAIDSFPNEWKAHSLLAEFYESQNNHEKALIHYRKSSELMPEKEAKKNQDKISSIQKKQSKSWSVSETEKEAILSNIMIPFDKNVWRPALVEKKENALHVVYALKNEDFRSGKWSRIVDMTCTYTSKQDSEHFNKINEWMASTYNKSEADMDTIEKTSTSRLYESIIHSKKLNILGYITPAKNGFCIYQFMYKKKISAKEKNKWMQNLKKITVRKF